MGSNTGLINAIAEVCDAADDLLSAREISERLTGHGFENVGVHRVHVSLRQATFSGRITCGEINGVLKYTTTPGWHRVHRGGRPRAKPAAPTVSTTAAGKHQDVSPASHAEAVQATSPRAETVQVAVVISPPAAQKARAPHGLDDRLPSIAQGLRAAHMPKPTGLVDRIATILDAADDSLSYREISERLADDGGQNTGLPIIRASINQASYFGRFIRSEINGVVKWTSNPEWTPKRRGKGRPVLDEVCAAAPTTPPARAPAPPAAVATSQPQLTTCPGGYVAGTGSRHVVRAPAPHGLDDRLQSIAQDLEDAVSDACRAQLDHGVIAQLTAAHGAAARALVALMNRPISAHV